MPVDQTGVVVPVMYEFKWEIEAESFQDLQVNDQLTSPSFTLIDPTAGGTMTEWKLRIYPKGRTNADSECIITVEVILIEGNLQALQKVLFTVSFLNLHNERAHINMEEKAFNKLNEEVQFLISETDCITRKNSTLIKNNKLTMMCQINILEGKIEDKKDIVKIECAEIKTPKFNLSNEFKKLMNSEKFSDVTVLIGEKKIFLHKNILATRSNVFASLFENDKTPPSKQKNKKLKNDYELVIDDVEYEVMEKFFEYIYSGSVDIDFEDAQNLLPIADKYCVEGLKSLCEQELSKFIHSFNVLKFLQLANTHNAEKLKINSIEWLSMRLCLFIDDVEFREFGLSNPALLYDIVRKNLKM